VARTDTEPAGKPEVSAAGGVVIRKGASAPVVAVIHRPKYMDWSLPKGKLDPGETFEQAAVREVEEEIGYRCELGAELPPITYRDRKGKSKLVRYWVMDPVEGEFSPGDEVDELLWLTLAEAEERLDYEHDREIVREALDTSS
jgi:8-oxo-dGTP diphosphatase